MHSLDTVTSQLHLKSYLGAQTCQLLVHGSIPYRLLSRNGKSLGCIWKGPPRLQMVAQAQTVGRKKHTPAIKVVATVKESTISQSDGSIINGFDLSQGSSPRVDEDEPELGDDKRQRRKRISKANKGKDPWIKGRKDSPETIKKFKERAIIAMSDPKVMSSKTAVRKKHVPAIKVVATVEESIISQSDEIIINGFDLSQGSSPRVDDDEPELGDDDKQRKNRISKANKGKVSWNKGRKDSPETKKKIKERAITAMSDSKVMSCKTAVQKKHVPAIKVVATVEESTTSESDESIIHGFDLSHGSSPRIDEDEPELDDVERQRRKKISKANKGKVPWNLGRKHSPETIKKIKERTKIAMGDPKVKLKMARNKATKRLHTPQEKEKISMGAQALWAQRRKEKLIKDSIRFLWQNSIAEASKTGFSGQEELQWNSFEILTEQLEEEWSTRTKALPRPNNVDRRQPMSPEHKRKISEAVYAKWQDPEYRKRCCEGKAKSLKGLNTGQHIRKRSLHGHHHPIGSLVMGLPVRTYKDPATAAKLERIKKVREQRAEMETRKAEAAKTARALIAEAEKAAKFLEAFSSTNSLALSSLLETRKLIAQAVRSLERIDVHEVPTRENGGNINIKPSPVLPSQPNCDIPSSSTNQDPVKTYINGHRWKPST